MGKIAFVTDTHLGVRGGSDIMREYFNWFWCDFFFPSVIKNKVTDIFHGGDFFDNQNTINAKDIDFLINVFIPLVEKSKINFHLILGNHDVHYRNTNKISIASIFNKCEYIKVYNKPTDVKLKDISVLLVPWINKSNYSKSLDYIDNSDSSICLGHFEIEGFKMYRQSISASGLSQSIFKKFDYTLSGHFHHASKVGNIRYLGSPYHLTWQDYPDTRGFYLYDIKKDSLDLIENETTLFNEIDYQDQDFTDDEINSLEGQFIKLVVNKKDDKTKYLEFIKKIKNIKTNKLDIIDKTISNVNKNKAKSNKNKTHDTVEIMNTYFDKSIDDKNQCKLVKNLSETVYNEALSNLSVGE